MPIYCVRNRISGKMEGVLQAADDLDAEHSVQVRWPEAQILDIGDMPQHGYREVVIGHRETEIG
jgi:hypothetical protein